MRFTRRSLVQACAAAACASLAPVRAQTTFPSRPIQLVVPFAPGGGNDALARIISPPLGAVLGQPVVVENRSGAGGNIGSQFVARSAADGHTLLLATNTLTLNPFLLKTLPFDVSKDFAPVARIANQPIVVVTHPSVPANNMKELVAYLKANVGRVFYATPGNGTPHHFAAELFKQTAGVFMVHVPYRGANPALAELLAGRVHVMFASIISALPFIRDGRLKVLATAEPQRLAVLKDLPTIKESGFPTYEATIWAGLMAPAGTPQPAVARISDAVNRIVANPEVSAQLRSAGFEIALGGPDDLGNLVRKDLAQWSKLAASLRILKE